LPARLFCAGVFVAGALQHTCFLSFLSFPYKFISAQKYKKIILRKKKNAHQNIFMLLRQLI
jgi:hypothetical protein